MIWRCTNSTPHSHLNGVESLRRCQLVRLVTRRAVVCVPLRLLVLVVPVTGAVDVVVVEHRRAYCRYPEHEEDGSDAELHVCVPRNSFDVHRAGGQEEIDQS